MTTVNMKAMFNSVKAQPSLTNNQRKYQFIEGLLKDGVNTPCNDLDAICTWMKLKYEGVYGKPMLGYNYYNCRNTVKQLAQKYEWTNWQACQHINKWFKLFHGLGYDKVASDDSLTLSVLKTDWIVSGLVDNRRPNESKRNSSFKTHSKSRRLEGTTTIPNTNRISNKQF